MNGYVVNIDQVSHTNTDFRRVLYTAKNSQLVVMSLAPDEDIGEEVHNDVDQFIRIESGEGKVVLDGTEHYIRDGWAIVIPAGTKHNVINTADEVMKLYTIYSPPHHLDGTVHKVKAEAQGDNEHFDGKTTEEQ